MDFDYDGMNEGSRRKVVAAFRQLIEVDNHKALVSVKSLDQHRVVKELVAAAFDKNKFAGAKIRGGPKEFTLNAGEGKGQNAIVDTTRIDQHMWCPSLVGSDRSVLRPTLYDAVEQEDRVTMCNVLRDAAKPVGIKKIGERSSLLWKLGQKTCEGKTCFDEELKGELKTEFKSGRTCGKYGQRLQPMFWRI